MYNPVMSYISTIVLTQTDKTSTCSKLKINEKLTT